MLWMVVAALCVACGASPPVQPPPAQPPSANLELVAEPGAPIDFVPQLGHSGGVNAITMSRGGRLMLTAARDRTLKLWDVEQGRLVRTFSEHFGETIVFAPDDATFFSAGLDRGFRHWDVSGKLLRAFEADASALAVSPDGSVVAAATNDSLVAFDVTTGAKRWAAPLPPQTKKAVAFSTDGKTITALANGNATAWDAGTGSRRAEPLIVAEMFPKLLPNGLIATRNVPGLGDRISVRDVASGKVVSGFDVPSKEVPRFTDDGLGLVTVRPGGALEIRDVMTGATRTLATRYGTDFPIGAVRSPDGRKLVVSADPNGALDVWDLQTGRLLPSLPSLVPSVQSIALSADGRRMLTGRSDGTAALWDLPTGRMVHVLGEPADRGSYVELSPDGKTALLGRAAAPQLTSLGMLELWDVGAGTKLRTLAGHLSGGAEHAVFTPDGRFVVSAGKDSSGSASAALWDVETGALVRQIGRFPTATSVAVSRDGKTVVLGGKDLFVLDAATDKVERRILETGFGFSPVAVSPDGRFIVSGTSGRNAGSAVGQLWEFGASAFPVRNLDHGDRNLSPVAGGTKRISSLSFSADGKRVLTTASDDTLRIWDASTGARLVTFTGHTNFVVDAAITAAGTRVVTASADGTSKIWDAERGTLLATFVSSGRDWILWSPDGSFDASSRGTHLLAMVQGTRVFGIEQFASELNRPDRVLASIGLAPPEIVAHFEERHRIRLQRLGLAEAPRTRTLHVPEARILEAKQDGRFVDLSFELEDGRVDLARYAIHVNGVPVLPGSGKAVSGRRATIRERIATTAGDNTIEVSAINAQGAESFRARARVTDASAPRRDLWFIGFGVSKYKDSRLDLGYAHKDALDLGRALARTQGAGFERVHIHTFVDADVTRAQIGAAKKLLQGAKVDDTVVLFIAGHGVHARDRRATYYFVTHDADVRRLADTAVSFEVVEELLADLAPRNKLFLMDTCASGEADPESTPVSLELGGKRGVTARAVRALVLDAEPAKKPRSFLLQHDRWIYNDVGRRTGAIVLSSSRGGEYSYESDELRNGYFTAEILASLTSPVADTDRNGAVSTDELRTYVSAAVSARSDRRQNPTIDRDNLLMRFSLPLAR